MPDDPKLPPQPHRQKGSGGQPAGQSKKFWAFIIAVFCWNVLIGVGIYTWNPPGEWPTLILLAMVMVQGVVEVGYIVGQAGLDALTHLFEILPTIFGGKKTE